MGFPPNEIQLSLVKWFKVDPFYGLFQHNNSQHPKTGNAHYTYDRIGCNIFYHILLLVYVKLLFNLVYRQDRKIDGIVSNHNCKCVDSIEH